MILLLPILLAAAACTTRKTVMARPLDSGIQVQIEAPFERVKLAALESLSDLSFAVKDEKWDPRDPNAYVVTSSQGLSSGSTGRYARIVIEKSETKQTVHVLVESKAGTRDAASIDDAVARDLESRLEKRVLSK